MARAPRNVATLLLNRVAVPLLSRVHCRVEGKRSQPAATTAGCMNKRLPPAAQDEEHPDAEPKRRAFLTHNRCKPRTAKSGRCASNRGPKTACYPALLG